MSRRDLFAERHPSWRSTASCRRDERADFERLARRQSRHEGAERALRAPTARGSQQRLRRCWTSRCPARLTTLADGRAARPRRLLACAAALPLRAAAVLLADRLARRLSRRPSPAGAERAEPAIGSPSEAIAAHTIYAAEKLHVVEVGADQKDHLVGWLSKRIGMTLVAPDLAAEGFELVGGRLLPPAEQAGRAVHVPGPGGQPHLALRDRRDEAKAETGLQAATRRMARRAIYWLDKVTAAPSSARCRENGCCVAEAPNGSLARQADV